MRRTTSLTALLLGATVLFPTSHATAVGETCRGEAATIVTGTTGVGTERIVTGTGGRDVIVAASSDTVNALGGDDLICVTRTKGYTPYTVATVDSGSGNDVVDTTATASHASVILGSGADTFYGGAGDDDVRTVGYVPGTVAPIPDTERDVVDAGAGDDRVQSLNGGAANPDVIATGPGDDDLYVEGPLAADGRLDGGAGVDFLETRADAGALSVQAGAGAASLDGHVWMRWSGMEGLSLYLGRVDLTYIGSAADDYLRVQDDGPAANDAPSITAHLGSGDDRLALWDFQPSVTTPVGAGSGRDTVEIYGTTTVRADLGAETLRWGNVASDLRGVENLTAYGSTVRVTGDDGRNVLAVGGCDTRAVGGRGADTLQVQRADDDGPRVDCDSQKMVMVGGAGNDRLDGDWDSETLRGGPGRDRLTGYEGNDTLVGGMGRDRADGGTGRDRCTAEVTRSCER